MVNFAPSNTKQAFTGSETKNKMPIYMLGVGNRRRITAVHGDDSVKKHLNELGLVEGAEVEVVAENGGNLILGLYGSRLAINRDLAKRIIV